MVNDKNLLVLRCNAFLKQREMSMLYRAIHEQMETGVIIVPPYIDVILVPEGTEIKISEFMPTDKKGEN